MFGKNEASVDIETLLQGPPCGVVRGRLPDWRGGCASQGLMGLFLEVAGETFEHQVWQVLSLVGR